MARPEKPIPEPTPENLSPPKADYRYFESAADHPLRANFTGFDLVNAAWLADAAFLAYGLGHLIDSRDFVSSKVEEAGLPGVAVTSFAQGGTACFVMSGPEYLIAAFRGTQIDDPHLMIPNLVDALTDAEFIPDATGVHTGFQEALARIWDVVAGFLDDRLQEKQRPVWFTGHSLGGALATLAANAYGSDKVQGLYTFGSPRVGTAKFAGSFDISCVRFVHGNDVVTTIPPPVPFGFQHVGNPVVHISHAGEVAEGSGEPIVFPSPIDHAPVYYASKLWNALWEEED